LRLHPAIALSMTVMMACATTLTRPEGPSCPGASLSPLLGCYEVVEAAPPAPGAEAGIRVGSLLQLEETQISLYNDAFAWVRMRVVWKVGAPALHGAYRGGGGEVSLETDPKGLLVVRHGQSQVAKARRVERGEPLLRLAGIPSLESVQARSRDCLSAFAALRPEDATFAQIDPARFETTASAHGILGMAQYRLAKACVPIPAPCALPPMAAQAREQLAAAVAACPRGAPRP
jgi:hypothetical protein